jgi:hypothetical protein
MIMKKSQIVFIAFILSCLQVFSQNQTKSFEDYIINRRFDLNGKEIVEVIVPGIPPGNHREPVVIPDRSAVLLNHVPAISWSFGCSATAASMAAGYYDNNGYPNMYAGPTNFGFMPMNNSSWGTAVINGETRDLCPLSATRNTLDSRTSRGHVDDYWILYGSSDPDPYITNGWTEHTHEDCTGDFMGTNQSALGASDGSTIFYFYVDGSPLAATTEGDGCYGLKLFYQSRGYSVVSYYNQYIYGWNGNTIGFTFDQYKNEINNGRPVLIQLEGHTVLGYGYDNSGQTLYVHDTWDYSDHTMTWGGSYGGMAHYGVAVVQLAPSTVGIVANFNASLRRQLINTSVTLYDWTWGNPTSWSWSISPSTYAFVGSTSSASQNPQVQFTAGGYYTITLTASNGSYQDAESRTSYIEAVDCSNFPFPVAEDFSEVALPFCWQNIDNQGNGQVWQFVTNISGRTISTSTASNGFAVLNSDAYGDGNSQNADLVTATLDLSSYSAVNLHFEHYFKEWSGSSGTLSYSINGGSSWTMIQTWTAETSNPAIFDQNVTAMVAGQSNVKFKWNYIGSWGYYWVVDDVSITGTLSGYWTGATSTAWATAGNWSDNTVPSSTTNVTIPSGVTNWPSYSGSLVLGTNCRDLKINDGAQLTVTSSFTIPSGRTLTMNGNSLLKIRGNWSNSGTFTCGPGGTVEFYGNSNGAAGGSVSPVFNKVIISKTSPNYFDFNINTTINKTLIVNTGATYKVKTGKTLTVQGNTSK